MKLKSIRRRCRHCGRMFTPDHRNQGRQFYCLAPECRRASKFASQRKWSRKTQNLAHFRGEEEVRRVQEWRKAHPGYWKKKSPASNGAQAIAPQAVKCRQESCNACGGCGGTLQDVCLAKNPLFVGLRPQPIGRQLHPPGQGLPGQRHPVTPGVNVGLPIEGQVIAVLAD